MTREFGSLGGRDDVYLPSDLPDLGRWRITDVAFLEADEVSPSGQFPTRGYFMLAELIDSDEEIYVGFTEGLQEMVAEEMENSGKPLVGMTVDVDTAEKAGSEETSPWRYSASIVHEDRLGPPSEDDSGE